MEKERKRKKEKRGSGVNFCYGGCEERATFQCLLCIAHTSVTSTGSLFIFGLYVLAFFSFYIMDKFPGQNQKLISDELFILWVMF